MINQVAETAMGVLTRRALSWRNRNVRQPEPVAPPKSELFPAARTLVAPERTGTEPRPVPRQDGQSEGRTASGPGREAVAARQQTLRVLAIGAHPDDLEIACGGTLAKLAANGHQIKALVMSDGRVGGDASVRGGEAIRGAATLGFKDIELCHLPDTCLDNFDMEMITAIERAIGEHQPDLLLTHSQHDQHQDHQAVHVATLRAGRFHPSILCFESPSVTRAFNPSVYVDIEEHLELKIRAIEQHQDQSGKPYMTADRISSLASFRGAQAKRKAAEGFEPVRVLSSAIGVFA
jgi:LmbE family N-acetylglucosaminyl deacetylase